MFNFCNNSNEITLLALVGLGLYAQSNNINLANNTTMLLTLFLLFLEHEEIQELKHETERLEFQVEDIKDITHKCGDNHRMRNRSVRFDPRNDFGRNCNNGCCPC